MDILGLCMAYGNLYRGKPQPVQRAAVGKRQLCQPPGGAGKLCIAFLGNGQRGLSGKRPARTLLARPIDSAHFPFAGLGACLLQEMGTEEKAAAVSSMGRYGSVSRNRHTIRDLPFTPCGGL